MSEAPPIVIVGAGAAGLAAGLTLQAAKAEFVILEARGRIGGRAHTIVRGGLPLDLGCEWLHHAEDNAWVERFTTAGIPVDRREAAWERQDPQPTFSAEAQADYHRAFEGLEQRIEAAAEAPEDQPVSALIDPQDRWAPLLNAFSAAYNGAPFTEISVKDYAAYDDGRRNWRTPLGYGAAMATLARDLPVRLDAAVERIEHAGRRPRVLGAFGALEASAVIVALPTPLLAGDRLVFDPPLPGKVQAAEALPLGHVAKVFLRLDGPEAHGREQMAQTQPLGPEPAALFLRGGDRPTAELFVGGDLAQRLEDAPEAEAFAFAVERLAQVFGEAVRRRVTLLARTAWSRDPWSCGAYSYARVGQHAARARLAEPVEDRLFFAGEAAHPTLFSTAHGAHDTGVAAAMAALKALGR